MLNNRHPFGGDSVMRRIFRGEPWHDELTRLRQEVEQKDRILRELRDTLFHWMASNPDCSECPMYEYCEGGQRCVDALNKYINNIGKETGND